jgi:hypothetical protein
MAGSRPKSGLSTEFRAFKDAFRSSRCGARHQVHRKACSSARAGHSRSVATERIACWRSIPDLQGDRLLCEV